MESLTRRLSIGLVALTLSSVVVPGCGGSDGQASLDILPACDPPAQLTATIASRRQTSVALTWTAPGATSYAVRYAKVPITFSNFDDTTVTKSFAYTGTPAASGVVDTVTVTGLTIEASYYFAVAAKDASGRYTWLQTTGAPTAAHFNVTSLAGTAGATEGFGVTLAGEGDANGDGKADLVVGASNSRQVYLYLGASSFAPLVASVVITGAPTGFGRSVSYIGDVDADGREDLAVADPSHNVLYIYKGRASWPATMTEANADYTVTTDASYTSSSLGSSISRLGDFNGDGIDDFAVGAPNFGGTAYIGRVVVVLGASGFSSFGLPSTTRAIVIDGDPALTRPFFGTRVVGMGHLYSGTGTTLVASAPGIIGIASSNEGHIYSFHGQSGTSGAISIASADATFAGASPNLRVGSALANLGRIFGAVPSVGAGNQNDLTVPSTGTGSVYAFSGASSAIFASQKTYYASAGFNVGVAVVGGGLPGRDLSLSILGDGTPDLVVLPKTGTYLQIVDGSTMASASSVTDALTSPTAVSVAIPSAFGALSPTAVLMSDVDGDSYPDFAISASTSSSPGKVAVYW
jgi:hypothetical protein